MYHKPLICILFNPDLQILIKGKENKYTQKTVNIDLALFMIVKREKRLYVKNEGTSQYIMLLP